MRIEVDTAADTRGEPAPSMLRFDGRNIDIADIVDRWWGAGDRFFKVKDAADNTYILRFEESRNAWELLMFVSKRGATMSDLLAKPAGRHPPPGGDGKL
jgi:hypothetical protein